MKKHLLALAASAFAFIASAATGNIYSIDPINTSDVGKNFESGEKIQFRVRLLAGNYDDPAPKGWTLKYTSIGSEEYDKFMSPLKFGIVVSGRLAAADVIEVRQHPVTVGSETAYPYTDLICEYKVKAGDLALPVLLALKGSTDAKPITPGSEETISNEYYLFNTDRWSIVGVNEAGDPAVCRLYFCDPATATSARSSWLTADIGNQTRDYSLAQCNFRAKAIGFDSNMDSAAYWRIVSETTTQTTYKPTIVTVGAPAEDAQDLYIWSKDETAVVMAGDAAEMDVAIDREGHTTKKMVAIVKIRSGVTEYPITIKGVTQGKDTELVLSPVLGYQFDTAGNELANYLTAKVYCSEPPSPNIQLSFDPANPTSAKNKTVETSMKTTENLADDAVPVYVTISEPYATDFTLQIAVQNEGALACNPITNHNISVSQYGDAFTASDNSYTNLTIKAGDTSAVFYVYPLGGDTATQTQGISFTPVLPDPTVASQYDLGARALLRIKRPPAPTIVVPESGADMGIVSPLEGFKLPLQLNACYRDLHEASGGFAVDIKSGSSTLYTKEDILFRESDPTDIEINEGLSYDPINPRKLAKITVKTPDGRVATSEFYYTVQATKTMTARLYDSTAEGSQHVGTEFDEGDAPIVRFTLSESLAVGEDRYAFLVPQNAASSNLVDCAAFREGVLIPGGQTNSVLNIKWALRLNDGCATTDGTGGILSYKIVLRTSDSLDEAENKIDEEFTPIGPLQLTVRNVFPKTAGVTVNGASMPVADGAHWPNMLSSGVMIPFVPTVSDVSINDKTNGLISVFCFTEGRNSDTWKYQAITTGVDVVQCLHRFTAPGTTQTVQVVTMDKDLLASLTTKPIKEENDLKTLWPSLITLIKPYTFTVGISTKPHVTVEAVGFNGRRMDETGNGRTAKLRITLSEAVEQDVKVRVTAKPGADENWGTLAFATDWVWVDESDHRKGLKTELTIKATKNEPDGSTGYVADEGLKFDYATLNGTAGSSDEGWEIIAEVVSYVKDTPEEPYYAKVEGFMIYVDNLAPKLNGNTQEQIDAASVTTNKSVTLGQAFEIKWKPSDVAADLAAVWPGTANKGLRAEWFVNDAQDPSLTTYVNKAEEQTTSITLNEEGLNTVRLVVTDVDGEDYNGVIQRTWYYYIPMSKRLTVAPVLPSRNTKSKYSQEVGRGLGRVWANGGAKTVDGFEQTWSYSVTVAQGQVYAFGYPAGTYVDDGSLGPGKRDVPIDPNGDYALAAPYYSYESEFNNYFYRWAYVMPSETGGPGTYEYGEVQPTLKPDEIRTEPIVLDAWEADKESYLTRRVEAIFSREYLAGDMLGDINRDGIPDIIAQYYAIGGSQKNQIPENDLEELDEENNDEDYLPTLAKNRFGSLIPGIEDSWVDARTAFNAKLELRGFHDGLNDALAERPYKSAKPFMVALPGVQLYPGYDDDDVDVRREARAQHYSEAEMMAWAETGYDKAWSPENPTDPTKLDTDKDGLSDGYEYYFWYWAHVGNIDKETGKLVHLTGERYNPLHPEKGDPISWKYIEEHMNPTVPNTEAGDDVDLIDSDNDGLVDTLEYELGTNPFHWDTDGDGLPDGYEVLLTNLDPLKEKTDGKADGETNLDGDFMAMVELPGFTLLATPGDDGRPVYFATRRPGLAFETSEAGEGWFIGIGDKSYLINDPELAPESVYRQAGDTWYLADDFDCTKVFAVKDEDGNLVRGLGDWLVAGTQLNGEPVTTNYFEKTLTTALSGNNTTYLDRSYAVWMYGKTGRFVLAKNADVAEGAVITDVADNKTITLLHHHVYQLRGFYFYENELPPEGGLVYGKDMGTGFDPRTAWAKDGIGYVNSRWHPSNYPYPDPLVPIYPLAKGLQGLAMDTEAYTTIDEFLLMNFRVQCGNLDGSKLVVDLYTDPTVTWEKHWSDNTTRASIPTKDGAEAPVQANAADTDGDGVPDGWELYVAAGPGTYDNRFSNWVLYSPNNGKDATFDADSDPITGLGIPDSLTLVGEFCGTDSMAAYAACESVPTENPYEPKWINKFLPTDPWSSDTDGDGISDGAEGYNWEKTNEPFSEIFGSLGGIVGSFIYGNPVDNGSHCVPGGGMNPCSWDTDFDGLPDPWEAQYHGGYATSVERCETEFQTQEYLRRLAAAGMGTETNDVGTVGAWYLGGQDATTPDSYTFKRYVNPVRNKNRDIDYDGLDPWQEYMTGMIRAFRYDDPLSPWTVPRKAEFQRTEAEFAEFLMTGKPLNPNLPGGSNPNLVFDVFDSWGAYGSVCRRNWDFSCGHWYFFCDGPNHALRRDDINGTNAYGAELLQRGYVSFTLNQFLGPAIYATCDPRIKDTDGDGMDDRYELFHGMNPLYGGAAGLDLINLAWLMGGSEVKATDNYWTQELWNEAEGNSPAAKLYDFTKFPWMAGDPEADPDGDDIRNIEEAIQANIESVKSWLHLDPTPLWMTDPSDPKSVVGSYYRSPLPNDQLDPMEVPNEVMGEVVGGSSAYTPQELDVHRWQVISPNNWDYEENEGYDSDHDGLSDYQEAASKASAQSDAQDENDPKRRQAIYFPGENSALQAKTDPIFGANNMELFFQEFTVECWVRPEVIATAKGQVILERTIRARASNPGDLRFYRRNYELGINSAGQFYIAYDHNGTGEPRVMATAQNLAAVNTWTHLAATYDGAVLRLYVNGEVVAEQPSTLRPASPAQSVITDFAYEIILNKLQWDNTLEHVIASFADESAMIFGASAVEDLESAYSALILGYATSDWSMYGKFYKGFLDEVRIWDGARSAREIADNFRTRFTAKDCLANRKAVYNAWVDGAMRHINPVGITTKLPPELAYHYTFDGLLAGAAPENVATSPFGFTADRTVGGKAKPARPAGWVSPWWATLPVHSLVYDDYAYVPWIPNTMTHLPRFDGTTLDSVFWSEDYAGFQDAAGVGFQKFDFPRTHELFVNYHPMLTLLDVQTTRETQIGGTKGASDEAEQKLAFTMRAEANNATDLLPLGNAYARYCTDMWDDEGASTNWDVTGTDDDNDLLADWWEKLVVAGGKDGVVYTTLDGTPITVEDLKADTVIKRNGVIMPAIEAYHRDLAGGAAEVGDESYLATTQYRQTVDEDKDGIPDWWEQLYGIDTGSAADADADPDGDGLSNFQEFLISEVFRYANLSPLLPRSDGYTLDYLLKVGELYVGEIFTDHDGMDNIWESQFNNPDYVNRYKFDPNEDRDGDGWSNLAEYRAETDPTKVEQLSIDGYVLAAHPVPVVKATVAYNGNNALTAPVVFMAWNEKSDPNMQEAPDAIWTLGNSEQNDNGAGSTTGGANSLVTMIDYEKFIGHKPQTEKTYYLTGGAISEGSFKLAFLDKGYSIVWYDEESGRIVAAEPGDPDQASWYYHIIDRQGELVLIGNTLYGDEGTVVGSIDYTTGRVMIDFTHPELCGEAFGLVESGLDGNTAMTGYRRYDYYNMDNSYVRMMWKSTKAGTTAAGTYYLADADKPSAQFKSRGYLREGKASFACFIDDDGDGKYTAGELYGFVRGVDVGWQGAEVAIEVTETSPVFARVDITTGDSDRKLMWGADSGDVEASLVVSNYDAQVAAEALSGGKYNHVRVVPYMIAGAQNDTAYYADDRAYELCVKYIPNRVVAEFDVNTETHPFITEADFIKDGKFDIDWDGFATTAFANDPQISRYVGDVTAVKYRLVLGKDGPVGPDGLGDTTTVVRAFSTLIERRFEPRNARTLPSELTLAGGQLLTAARPTFQWRLNESTSANGYAASAGLFGCSYTAFQIEVADAETNEKIYDSGVVRAPARDAQGRFAWQAPLCAGGQTALDKIFARAGNWKWRVAMYNAKFKPGARNGWSEYATFSTAVNQQQEVDDHGYSMIRATIKYAGPEVVLKNCANIAQSKGIVRVQAFANGDFAGEPAAEALVTNKLALVNTTDHAANAELCGLAPGRWYVRAYVDTNGNHQKDAWESWGYAREAVTIATDLKTPSVELYIDDADTDNDALPDAWEVVTYGNLDHENAYVDPKGEIVLATQTYASITNGSIGLPKNFPSASLQFFRNFDAARLLLGLDPSETTGDSIADIRAAVERNVKPGSVKVTAMNIDPDHKQITFTVVGDLEEATNNLLAPAYAIPQGVELAVRVWRKSSLVESEWSWVADYPRTVSTEIETTVIVDVKEELTKQGYYKIEIVKGSEILKK